MTMNSTRKLTTAIRPARLGAIAAITMLTGALACLPAAAQQPAQWQMSLQAPHSTLMSQMTAFHGFLLYIIFGISILVLGLLLFTVVRFNEKRNPTPSRRTHNTMLEVVWSVVPIFILMVIGVYSLPLLFASADTVDADMTVKVIGRQWYWSYEYPDHGDFTFDAFRVEDDQLEEGQVRLLSTDENLVVPVGKKIRVLVTSSDVLHSFAVPSLGTKVDAVPGRTNEVWINIDKPGMYYGQCSELCGSGHAFMPVAVKAVTQADFDAWVTEAREKFADADTKLTPRPVRFARNDAPVSAGIR